MSHAGKRWAALHASSAKCFVGQVCGLPLQHLLAFSPSTGLPCTLFVRLPLAWPDRSGSSLVAIRWSARCGSDTVIWPRTLHTHGMIEPNRTAAHAAAVKRMNL